MAVGNPFTVAAVVVMLAAVGVNVSAADLSGYVATEWRDFVHDALADPQDYRTGVSLSVNPELVSSWRQDKRQIRFSPFVRIDTHDSERSHADIRELSYSHALREWEWRVGVRKVFWGVTESQHLVDIINQTDFVEALDGEEKLGQPMINAAWIKSWGTLDFFVLPYFRERPFAGSRGRLRVNPPVDMKNVQYESPDKEKHTDFALRYSHTLGDWDLGLAYFNGTARSPRLIPQIQITGPVLIPYYDLMQQVSIDLQATKEAWLWKLESIYQHRDIESYAAGTGGFEYTFFDLSGTGMDVGLVCEYLWDDRGAKTPTPFEDDVMVGVRLALNDAQSTDALIAVVKDRHSGQALITVEANRRLTNNVKLGLEGGFFSHIHADDVLGSMRRDDYIQVEFAYHF